MLSWHFSENRRHRQTIEHLIREFKMTNQLDTQKMDAALGDLTTASENLEAAVAAGGTPDQAAIDAAVKEQSDADQAILDGYASKVESTVDTIKAAMPAPAGGTTDPVTDPTTGLPAAGPLPTPDPVGVDPVTGLPLSGSTTIG
jgi:hypothetical protein